MYAFAHAPLDGETIGITSVPSGDILYAFLRGFHCLNGLPIFSQNKILFSQISVDQCFALVYFDKTVLQYLNELHNISLKLFYTLLHGDFSFEWPPDDSRQSFHWN